MILLDKAQSSNDNDDGMKMDCEIFNLRFSEDLRINEVHKLLCSTQPVTNLTMALANCLK